KPLAGTEGTIDWKGAHALIPEFEIRELGCALRFYLPFMRREAGGRSYLPNVSREIGHPTRRQLRRELRTNAGLRSSPGIFGGLHAYISRLPAPKAWRPSPRRAKAHKQQH